MRFDRVLYRGQLVPTSIELVGTEPLEDLSGVWPSDHFGLELGRGFGVSTGDSTLATIVEGQFRCHAPLNKRFLYFNKPLALEEWQSFNFELPEGALLLLYTDGVNECHYRKPESSVQPSHLVTLWEQTGFSVEPFAGFVMELALGGVMGHPGGEDNIALITLARYTSSRFAEDVRSLNRRPRGGERALRSRAQKGAI